MKLTILCFSLLVLSGCGGGDRVKINPDAEVASRIKTMCDEVGGKVGFGIGLTEDIYGREVMTRNYFCITQTKRKIVSEIKRSL